MKKQNHESLSAETLNALVDKEFPTLERAELLAQLQNQEQAKKTFCEINHTKDRVKTAYADIPQPVNSQSEATLNGRFFVKVASFVIALVIIGVVSFGFNSDSVESIAEKTIPATPQRLVVLDPDGRGQTLSQNSLEELRVIFHVSNSRELDAEELLNDIEGLLKLSIQNNQQVRVEVVAHASGLDLLRERLSTAKTRIAAMSKSYPELTFVACLNTVDRIKREQGIDVKLIPDAKPTQSGVAHVVKRQQQGWLYIQV